MEMLNKILASYEPKGEERKVEWNEAKLTDLVRHKTIENAKYGIFKFASKDAEGKKVETTIPMTVFANHFPGEAYPIVPKEGMDVDVALYESTDDLGNTAIFVHKVDYDLEAISESRLKLSILMASK